MIPWKTKNVVMFYVLITNSSYLFVDSGGSCQIIGPESAIRRAEWLSQ